MPLDDWIEILTDEKRKACGNYFPKPGIQLAPEESWINWLKLDGEAWTASIADAGRPRGLPPGKRRVSTATEVAAARIPVRP
ncbi:Homeobox Protein Nkx-2.6 [Manis pentadactyla]|nr:Homeobox Protein Nkx-2.6 [Manis pentadactyla]